MTYHDYSEEGFDFGEVEDCSREFNQEVYNGSANVDST